jgi:hypothetical protein
MAVALDSNGGGLGSLKLEATRNGYEELDRWYHGGQRERARISRFTSALLLRANEPLIVIAAIGSEKSIL